MDDSVMHVEYFYVTKTGDSDSSWVYIDGFEFPNGCPKESHTALVEELLSRLFTYETICVTYLKDISTPVQNGDVIERDIWFPQYEQMRYSPDFLNKYQIDPYECPICKRHMPTPERSKHHMVPRSEGGKGDSIKLIHRVCHDKVHSIFTEKELASGYNTIQALLGHPEIKKFVSWVSKKPNNFYQHNKRHGDKY